MADPELYDPSKIILVVGANVIGGFADGSHVKAAYDEPRWSRKKGNDGGGTRVRNPDKGGYIEFILRSTSPSNAILSNLAGTDYETGQGVIPVQITDLFGTTDKVHSEAMWLVNLPDMEWEKEAGKRTWRLETFVLDIFAGGAAA